MKDMKKLGYDIIPSEMSSSVIPESVAAKSGGTTETWLTPSPPPPQIVLVNIDRRYSNSFTFIVHLVEVRPVYTVSDDEVFCYIS